MGQRALHIRQGELDGACGQSAVQMALMLLGIIDRDELDDPQGSGNKPLAKMWKRAITYYFTGTSPKELQSLLNPYQGVVSSRFVRKNQLDNTLACLAEDGVCIVGISNKYFSHWVLAVGVSYPHEDLEPDALLLLDSDAPASPLSPWNAMLSIKGRKGLKHHYASAEGDTKVVIDNVLTITACAPILDSHPNRYSDDDEDA